MDVESRLSFSDDVIEVFDDQIKIFNDKNISSFQKFSASSLSAHHSQWMESQDISLKKLKDQRGLVCLIPKGEKRSIQINYLSSSPMKVFILLEEASSLSWFENLFSPNVPVETYIYMAKKSQLHKLTFNSQGALLQTVCELCEDSSFLSFDFHLHSAEQKMKVIGQGFKHSAILQGLNLLHEKQHVHQRVETQHEGEDGYGRQKFYSVVGGKSKSHVHSKVVINAQGTDSHQMLKNFVLDPYAQAKNQPELEVSKDQVKATHGSTTGQPNPLEIFYMNTRGLSQKKALEFLVQSWVETSLKIDEELDTSAFSEQIQQVRKLIQKHIDRILSTAS